MKARLLWQLPAPTVPQHFSQSFADYEGQIKGDIEDLTTSLHALKKTVNSMDTSVTTLHGAGMTNPMKAIVPGLVPKVRSLSYPPYVPRG